MADPQKTKVNLRIEGKTRTFFEGPVFTCGHKVSTPSGGIHHCDGTNNDKNLCVGPTCITALDDGNKSAKFGFDATFLDGNDDFKITSIGEDKAYGFYYWVINLNFVYVPDGCQQKVKEGDEVLFAYKQQHATEPFYLKLTGPSQAFVSTPVTLLVTHGLDGLPISGAQVDGRLTDNLGRVTLTFMKVGTQTLKAERLNATRSNALTIQVIERPKTKL
jgi:hypothetical protein